MMKLFTTLCAATLLTGAAAFAQDIHYSQFYASPMTLNPALTGAFNGNYRVGALYRNQWSSVTVPYVTPSFYGDVNNIMPKMVRKGTVNVGVQVVNDKAGDGELTTMGGLLSGSYVYPLDADHKHNVAFGMQFGFQNKKLNWTKLVFESNWNGLGFDPNYGTQDATEKTASFTSFQWNWGLAYAGILSQQLKVYGGITLFNLNTAKETFTNYKNDLGMRSVIHMGAEYFINNKTSLMPNLIFMGQTKAMEFNIGCSIGYRLKAKPTDATVFGGLYFRAKDALIAMAGIEYRNTRLGLSYDVNVSSLSEASGGMGGFELSLQYIGLIGGIISEKPIMFCPRF